jgi:hypothetical protein
MKRRETKEMAGKEVGVRLPSFGLLLLILLPADCEASAPVSYLASLSTQRCLVQVIWTKNIAKTAQSMLKVKDVFELLTNNGIPYISTNDWRYECKPQPESLKVAGIGHAGRGATSTQVILVNIDYETFSWLHACHAFNWQRVNGPSLWFHFLMTRSVFDEYASDQHKKTVKFASKIRKFDATVVFTVDDEASLVCPHCSELFDWKPVEPDNLTQFRTRFVEMRHDLRGIEVAVTDNLVGWDGVLHAASMRGWPPGNPKESPSTGMQYARACTGVHPFQEAQLHDRPAPSSLFPSPCGRS